MEKQIEITPEKAYELAERYEYWEIKDEYNVRIAHSNKKNVDSFENELNSLADDYDFLFVNFSDNEKNKRFARKHIIIFDLNSYKKSLKGGSIAEREKPETRKTERGFLNSTQALGLINETNNIKLQSMEERIKAERIKSEAEQATTFNKLLVDIEVKNKNLLLEMEYKEKTWELQKKIDEVEREKKDLEKLKAETENLIKEAKRKKAEALEEKKSNADIIGTAMAGTLKGIKNVALDFMGLAELKDLDLKGFTKDEEDEEKDEEEDYEDVASEEEAPKKVKREYNFE